jgi:hypothetical protein
VSSIQREQFDHIGVITEEKQDAETWVEATRVWVTSPRAHSHHVEFLRFESDTPVTGPLRTEPHVAYRVANLEAAMGDAEVLLAPFTVGDGFARVAFVRLDGALIEYMEYADPNEKGWF